jgi:DNA-3-methyladenine glycosylase II
LIKSIKEIKQLPVHITKEEIINLAERWRPNRTIAAFILWHAYLSKRKRKT